MSPPLDILGLTHDALCAEMGRLHGKPGKGTYHGDAVFQALHRGGSFDPASLPEFAANPGLAQKAAEHFSLRLPDLADKQGDGDTYKFLLKLAGDSKSAPGGAL